MKKLMPIALFILAPLVLITSLVFMQQVDPNQVEPDIEPYDFPDTLANRQYDLDSLKALIGDNKGLPEGFEVAGAIAFSAYPQLKDVKVDMVLTEDGAPMESSMNPWSLFGLRKWRQYKILLNNGQRTCCDPILLRALPLDAQAGILAHELGHTVYYHELNVFQIGKWGLMYLQDEEFRAAHERATDLMPVYHGLGSQIYQYAHFVRRDSTTRDFYEDGKEFMDTFYMTDHELLEIINN